MISRIGGLGTAGEGNGVAVECGGSVGVAVGVSNSAIAGVEVNRGCGVTVGAIVPIDPGVDVGTCVAVDKGDEQAVRMNRMACVTKTFALLATDVFIPQRTLVD
jgi:hypothetical protein